MPVVARAVALVIVAVFCFHLSRFYLSIELCKHDVKDGNTMQHCKDLLGWLTAPRAEMNEASTPVHDVVLAVIPAQAETQAESAPDVSLPPPFHPPRFLS